MAIPREPGRRQTNKSSDGLRRDYTPTPNITIAYLLGVLHDATERKTTFRISSKSQEYCLLLKNEIMRLGRKAWVYKEGRDRNVWIVEFSKSLLINAKIISMQDKIDYVRGYFDTEGGISKSKSVRYYIYFAQKDKNDLMQVKSYLEEFGIFCGKLHNPSKKVDPNYWRFYVSAKSYNDFARLINSYHPEKRRYIRMKI